MRNTRYGFVVALMLATAIVAGCASPGATCDRCAEAEAKPSDGGGAAAAAAVSGGQHASSNPDVQDIGAPNPVTTIGRGSGNTEATSTYTADKTANGSLAVTQAWTADSQAIAEAMKTAPPSVVATKQLLDTLNLQLAALAPNDPTAAALTDRIERIVKLCGEQNAEFFKGLAMLRPDFKGAVLVQTVLAGSAVNGRAVDPLNAAAAATGLPATVDAAARAKAAAGHTDAKAAEGGGAK